MDCVHTSDQQFDLHQPPTGFPGRSCGVLRANLRVCRQVKAFTLIELLVVIGVIGILIGIIAIGFNVVFNDSSTRLTRVALENAIGMQQEYENATPLPAAVTSIAVNSSYPDSSTATAPRVPYEIYIPTIQLMNEFMRVPANQDSLAKGSATQMQSVTANAITATLLTDGWGKPIIFVGRGGLTSLQSTAANGTLATRATLQAPDGRPFWVSAGPDGNFRTHDDNVYSFEN